jgi:hypothetical protein
MAVRAFYRNEIRASILAGVVLAVQTSTAHGPVNLDFIAGALSAYRHQATVFGVSWSRVIGAARGELGAGYDALLEAANRRLIQ